MRLPIDNLNGLFADIPVYQTALYVYVSEVNNVLIRKGHIISA